MAGLSLHKAWEGGPGPGLQGALAGLPVAAGGAGGPGGPGPLI